MIVGQSASRAGVPGSHAVSKIPRAPAGLKAAGRALWRDLVNAFEWEEHELHLVRMACVHADLWERSTRGRTTRDRADGRAEAVVVARILRELRVHQAADARPPNLVGGRRE